jgi:hypothetical protein
LETVQRRKRDVRQSRWGSNYSYSVKEVLEHAKFKGIAEEGEPIIDLSMLEEVLPAKKNAFVLIFPTATSVVFMINERGEIMLIDSHKHSDTYGAIAATAPQNELKDMIKYIKETMSEGKEFEVTRVKLHVTSEQELSEQVEQQLSEQVSNIHARTDRSLEIIICWRQL